jgi:hypothetical protein
MLTALIFTAMLVVPRLASGQADEIQVRDDS